MNKMDDLNQYIAECNKLITCPVCDCKYSPEHFESCPGVNHKPVEITGRQYL